MAYHHMLRRPNKTAQRYDNHKERVAKAIKDSEENPGSKIKHVAAHYRLTRDILHSHYYGKTQAGIEAHPKQRLLTGVQEESVEE